MKQSKSMVVVFLTPALVFFCLVFLYPIARTVMMSLFSVENVTSPINQWKFTGFKNYVTLAQTSLFWQSMWNMFRIWAVGGVFVMLLALLFAVIINSGIRFKKFFRAVLYLPNIISAVALATMWLQYVFANRWGMLTNLFAFLGLDELAAIQWTAAGNKFWAMAFAYCFGMVGYHMLIFSSGIEKIPPEFYEASSIDGASRVSQFSHITLPLLKGVIKTNITMWTITSVGFFVWSQLFSTVTTDLDTITPMVYMYLQVFSTGNTVTTREAGLGAAIGVILGLCVVLVFVIANLLLREDEMEY